MRNKPIATLFTLLLALNLATSQVPLQALAVASASSLSVGQLAVVDESSDSDSSSSGGGSSSGSSSGGSETGDGSSSGDGTGNNNGSSSGDGNGTGGGENTGNNGNNGSGTEQPEPTYVSALAIRDEALGPDGSKHYLGESYDPGPNNAYLQPTITTKGKVLQMSVFYFTNKDPYTGYSASDQGAPLGAVNISWVSSDNTVATVSPTGEMTARGNGTVTITALVAEATKYTGDAPKKQVTFNVDGQEGEYVIAVSIFDEDGLEVGEKNPGFTTVFTEPPAHGGYYQFSARVTWADTDGELIRVEDTAKGDKISSSIIWTMGGSEQAAHIANERTGRIQVLNESGNAYLTCTVTGGVGGKVLSDTARIQVDNGSYQYNPADSLVLRTYYQDYPDIVVQEHTYTLAELATALPAYTYNYTVIGGGSGSHGSNPYGWIRATGYLFNDIMNMEGVRMEEVRQFSFRTPDNYPQPISYQKLYGMGNRYYFPHWEISSRADAQVVPPMLALMDAHGNGASSVNPSVPFDEAARFHLVFGPLYSCEKTSEDQVKWIRGIDIILSGSPPANPGIGPGETEGPGDGEGDGRGGGGTGNVGVGGGASGEDSGGTLGRHGGNQMQSDAPLGNANDMAGKPGEGALGSLASGAQLSGGYRVYEMLSNAQSKVDELVIDYPLTTLAAPLAAVDLAAGFALTYLAFKRRARREQEPCV